MLTSVGKEQKTNTAKIQPIALRITDKGLYERIEELSKQQNLSMNMTVNMLLGFAFNEVDRQKKTFISKVVFESK
jgi:hypothetical protein